MRIAVTGANGFVGREVVGALRAAGHVAVPIVRRPAGLTNEIVTGPLEDIVATELAKRLVGVDAVAHLAARTHVRDAKNEAPAAYRQVNVMGTERLIDAVTTAGVARIVYMSSIKVNGEETRPGQRYAGSDKPAPEDDYGRTKYEAEQLITTRAMATGLQSVILRPPMVYGADVAGNFARLVAAVRCGIPLPVGWVNNRRSLISVRNLADATVLALTAPDAAGAILTLSDGEDVSTRALIEAISAAVGRPARLFPLPMTGLRLAGRLLGLDEEMRRLVGNLQVNSTRARSLLDWTPREQLPASLRRMLEQFHSDASRLGIPFLDEE